MSTQKVLVVDDEASIRHTLERMLKKEGLEVLTASDGQEALDVFEASKPDLVLLDVKMPKMNGFEVCERLKADPESNLTPVVMVTSSASPENRVRGLDLGANDFISKPFERVELTARVRSLLSLKRSTDELERAETVLFSLAISIEGKDTYTGGHCERLSKYSVELGRRLGLPNDQLVALQRGGIVHDIGKVAVPDEILLKQGPLSPDEWAVMKQHPVVGAKICRSLKSFGLVIPIIRHHHEKRDGSGYPDGLQGDEIPLTARILQVVDIYDALATDRPYREAWPMEKALSVMQEEVAKGWWDPDVFREFDRLVRSEGFDLQESERFAEECAAFVDG